jgi:GTP-binding protein HflX
MDTGQEILLTDTVGFIRKLPHLLVAAFKSTLEEAFQADVLLHIVDASHPMAEEQAETTFEVLRELNSEDRPIITVLNKIDLCTNRDIVNRIRIKYTKTVEISALKKTGFHELQEIMLDELSKRRKVLDLKIPQSDYSLVSEITRIGNLIHQDYEENDILLKIELPIGYEEKLKTYIRKP